MQEITKGQKLALILLAKACGVESRDERLFLVSHLLCRGVGSFNDLNRNDWRQIRDEAHPRWPDDNWETSPLFKARASAILREYREQVLGQTKMGEHPLAGTS